MIYERGVNIGERWRLHLHKRWGVMGLRCFCGEDAWVWVDCLFAFLLFMGFQRCRYPT
jgi:hypothetical protein